MAKKDPITKEVKRFCSAREFLGPVEMVELRAHFVDERFKLPLELELDRRFVRSRCPACLAEGMFRWHFLGRLCHPRCATWLAGSGTYAKRFLKFAVGGALAFGADVDDGAGAIILLIVGAAAGLAAFLLMTPVQLLARLVAGVRRPV